MTVKEKRRGRPARAKDRLNAESIILCARVLLLEDGKVPSIRKVAGELNVDPMAIYHYFANKTALLEAVTVSLVEEIYKPIASSDWQVELYKLCESYLLLLKDHGGLLETMLSMSEVTPAQVFAERFHTVLTPLKLDEKQWKNALDLLVDYLHGFALAMHCNKQQTLNVGHIQGPIKFYIESLTRIAAMPTDNVQEL